MLPRWSVRGIRAEHYVRDVLEKMGFLVVRSAGSHTPIDLIAGKNGRCFGVQVKMGRFPPKKELKQLVEFCRELGISPAVASNKGGGWSFYVVGEDLELLEDEFFKRKRGGK